MKRKFLLVVGLGVGYVVGARAGREKYDAMKAKLDGAWESPRVRRARLEVESYARQQAPIIRDRAEAAAKAAPGVIADGARRTATVAKDVADRTVAVAKDVADKTVTTAKDVADKTVTTAKDVAGKTATTAKDVAGKTSTAAKDTAERAILTAGAARDDVLEDDPDYDNR